MSLSLKPPCIEFRAAQDEGNIIHWAEWKLSPDMTYLLVKADHLKVGIPHGHSPEMLMCNF